MSNATNPLSWTYAYLKELEELARMDAMTDEQILAEMPSWGYSPERGDTPAEARADQRAAVARYRSMAELENND